MSNPCEELGRLLEDAGLRVVIGLRQQGHMPTVERMLTEGASWDAIGQAIGWNPRAAKEWYERETSESL
jgi:predicted Rossmann-fold nucleotide-binding protein